MTRRAAVSIAAASALLAFGSNAQSLLNAEPVAADAYPVVLTPTRLRQSLQDVPASVTIVTAETMQRYGITSIVDALRLVPGMAISQPSGNDYRINYHGTNALTPRRMNVLIDGMSVYQPGFARVDWANLPVSIEDIDRIEVTRGPNSAAYGPNSMMAIVNIITKHPDDVEPGLLVARVGTRGALDVTARFGATIGGTALRLTANRERNSGYDQISRLGNDHDSTSLARLNLRTHTTLNSTSTLDLDAGYLGGVKDEDAVEPYQRTFPDQRIDDAFVSGSFATSISPTHELVVRGSYRVNRSRQEWNSCPPTALLLPEMFALWQANPSYAQAIVAGGAPTGGSPTDDALARQALAAIRALGPRALQPTCADVEQSYVERRLDLEVQDTYVASDRLRVVGGFGLRRQSGASQTYVDGKVTNSLWRIFGNVEWMATDSLNLNLGAYSEHDTLSDRTSTSPRIAANLRLSDNQAIRLVWSTGARTPDVQEQRALWSYSFENATPPVNGSITGRFYQSAISPGGLRHERIRSTEVGYLLNAPTLGLLFDAKVFEERLSGLISEKLQVSSYEPTNNGSVRLRGAELQANLQLSSRLAAFAQYAYLDNVDPSSPLERTLYSRHSGALGVSGRFDDGWAASLAYYGSSGNGLGQSSYGRTDVTLSKAFTLARTGASVSLILRRLDRKTATTFRDFGDSPASVYDDRLQIFGQLRVSF